MNQPNGPQNPHYGAQVPPPPGQPFPPQPVAPARKQPKTMRRSFAIVGMVGALVLGWNVGAVGGEDEAAVADPAPTATTTVTTKAEAPKEEKPKEEKPRAAKKEKPKQTVVTDGTWEVGVDTPAGTYKGTVPDDSINCYVETASDNSGTLDSIIANENYNPGARVTLTVKDGQFLTMQGCGELVKS